MAEVLFFILGAIFSLMLLLAVLVLLSANTAQIAQPVMQPAAAAPRAAAPRSAPRPAPLSDPLPRLGSPSRQAQAEREAYRISCALEVAQRALARIAQSGESAAAKIASQTLRRLAEPGEPAAARLRFARARLDLLALRPEPKARAEAAAALHALA